MQHCSSLTLTHEEQEVLLSASACDGDGSVLLSDLCQLTTASASSPIPEGYVNFMLNGNKEIESLNKQCISMKKVLFAINNLYVSSQ
jgi:hypothetical protein